MVRFSNRFAILPLLIFVVACTPNGDRSDSAPSPTNPISTTNSPSPRPSQASAQPQTRAETISVEGEQRQITLNLFENPDIPVTTYVPDTFMTDVQSFDGGKTVGFFLKKPDGSRNPQAYVEMFFPTEPMTVEQLEKTVTGEEGLLAGQKRQISDRTTEVPYSWAKERLTFRSQAADPLTIGSVWIGEHNGQAFRIVEHYPADYGDGFSPLASQILQNLEFKVSPTP
jgi:hypothetical protein